MAEMDDVLGSIQDDEGVPKLVGLEADHHAPLYRCATPLPPLRVVPLARSRLLLRVQCDTRADGTFPPSDGTDKKVFSPSPSPSPPSGRADREEGDRENPLGGLFRRGKGTGGGGGGGAALGTGKVEGSSRPERSPGERSRSDKRLTVSGKW